MTGRDPDEAHRSSTPLELLFDLMFVVAFSQAGSQTAHLLELGHWGPAIGGFAFAVFAIWWAWLNYSWLASAYDNDDVFFRVATMVEMLGVLVLALVGAAGQVAGPDNSLLSQPSNAIAAALE